MRNAGLSPDDRVTPMHDACRKFVDGLFVVPHDGERLVGERANSRHAAVAARL